VWVLPHNQGKGAAVLRGLRAAREAGFTHALTMDSDGQHPADLIPAFMQRLAGPARDDGARPPGVRCQRAAAARARAARVERMDPAGDAVRRRGRLALRLSRVPGDGADRRDARQPWMRRFDFDTEAVVRLAWRGVKPVNIDAPVKYLTAEEGGVSHFRYGRDNVLRDNAAGDC
jgi:glycosyltransferase involved in cell wall biosynthesis